MSASAAALWSANRRRLLDIAYRMLGSRSDAEDVLQVAYLRLSQESIDEIRDPTGWLITVTGRLCVDHLRSSRVTREAYVGPWLPEPIVDRGPLSDPADRVTLDDTVRMAMLIVLEQLSPPERAAFILHDVFQVPFDAVADVVGRTPQACRQLASRARRRLALDGGTRFTTDAATAREAARRFAAAAETGDLDGLIAVLDPAVQGLFDSGGHITGAPTDVVIGSKAVASILVSTFGATRLHLRPALVNGEPGITAAHNNRIVSVVALETGPEGITRVHGIGNPDKLARLASHLDPTESYKRF